MDELHDTNWIGTDSLTPSSMDQNKKKELLKRYKRNEKDALLESFPIPIGQLNKLFEYVDGELEYQDCDHTLKLTKKFLDLHKLPEKETIEWLNSHGGYCDCEVLFNTEEKVWDHLSPN